MIVVVPLAGRGSRFADEGYDVPKPLIKVAGKHMIQWALKSLEGVSYDEIIFVALKEHEVQFGISQILTDSLDKKFELLLIDEVTEGQLCTVLIAKEYFLRSTDLLIIASDSLVNSNIGIDICNKDDDVKGIISVFNLPGDRWSFARTNALGEVVEVAEKVRISDYASTGIYYFSDASKFLEISEDLIARQEKTNGEFYIIPVYQKMIQNHEKVSISIAFEMWDMGTPDSKRLFECYLNKSNG